MIPKMVYLTRDLGYYFPTENTPPLFDDLAKSHQGDDKVESSPASGGTRSAIPPEAGQVDFFRIRHFPEFLFLGKHFKRLWFERLFILIPKLQFNKKLPIRETHHQLCRTFFIRV